MTNQVKLHVGYIGKTREGKRVEIVRDDDSHTPFLGSDSVWRYSDGKANITEPSIDIIGPWTNDKPEYETGVWYGWNGGECPVHPETVVDIADHDGTSINVLAREWKWDHKYDPIIAFRIVTPYVEPRKPREVWVVYDEYGSYAATRLTESSANIYAGMYCGANGTVVRMIEADDQ